MWNRRQKWWGWCGTGEKHGLFAAQELVPHVVGPWSGWSGWAGGHASLHSSASFYRLSVQSPRLFNRMEACWLVLGHWGGFHSCFSCGNVCINPIRRLVVQKLSRAPKWRLVYQMNDLHAVFRWMQETDVSPLGVLLTSCPLGASFHIRGSFLYCAILCHFDCWTHPFK